MELLPPMILVSSIIFLENLIRNSWALIGSGKNLDRLMILAWISFAFSWGFLCSSVQSLTAFLTLGELKPFRNVTNGDSLWYYVTT